MPHSIGSMMTIPSWMPLQMPEFVGFWARTGDVRLNLLGLGLSR
jgi:hypothetical protein